MVRWKKSCLLGRCQNGVLAPYCKDWEPRYPPNTSKRLQFLWIPFRYHQTPPRHPTETSKTFQGNITCQKTPTDTARHPKTMTGSVWVCLVVLIGVYCCLFACRVPWRCLWDVWGMCLGCLGGVWRYLSGICGNWRRLDVFGGYHGSQSLLYGAKTLFWHIPKRHDFLSPDQTETLK